MFALTIQLALTAVQIMRAKVGKGVWWMPWHAMAMKDVTSCEKPRGAAKKLRSVGLRMGQPRHRDVVTPVREGKPSELKHLSKRRKRKQ